MHHGTLLIFKDKDFRKMFDITDYELKMKTEDQYRFIRWIYKNMPNLEKKLSKINRFKSLLRIRNLTDVKYWRLQTPFYFIEGTETCIAPSEWTPLIPHTFLIPKKWLEVKERIQSLDDFKKLPKESQDFYLGRIESQYLGGAYQKKDIDFELMDKEFREQVIKEIAWYKELDVLDFKIKMPLKDEIIFLKPNLVVLNCKKVIDIHDQLNHESNDFYRPFYEIYEKYIANLDDNDWLMTADYNN